MTKRAISYKSSVSTFDQLPKTGNTLGDVRSTRDTGDQYFWSISASSGARSNWDILNNTPILSSEKSNLEIESAFIAAELTNYKELTYSGSKVINVDIYVDNTKVIKLFSKVLAYTGDKLTSLIITRISDSVSITKTFVYSGSQLINITIT